MFFRYRGLECWGVAQHFTSVIARVSAARNGSSEMRFPRWLLARLVFICVRQTVTGAADLDKELSNRDRQTARGMGYSVLPQSLRCTCNFC